MATVLIVLKEALYSLLESYDNFACNEFKCDFGKEDSDAELKDAITLWLQITKRSLNLSEKRAQCLCQAMDYPRRKPLLHQMGNLYETFVYLQFIVPTGLSFDNPPFIEIGCICQNPEFFFNVQGLYSM